MENTKMIELVFVEAAMPKSQTARICNVDIKPRNKWLLLQDRYNDFVHPSVAVLPDFPADYCYG
jgi:hypothetical protein